MAFLRFTHLCACSLIAEQRNQQRLQKQYQHLHAPRMCFVYNPFAFIQCAANVSRASRKIACTMARC